MSVVKLDSETFRFYCDDCGESAEYSLDFREAWIELKRQGWRCWRDRGGDWCHRCPDCEPQRVDLDRPLRRANG